MKFFDKIIKLGLVLGSIWLGPKFLRYLTDNKNANK